MSLASVPRNDRRLAMLLAGGRAHWRLAVILFIHAATLTLIWRTEVSAYSVTLALLVWALLNLFWLAILRRPAMSAALSLLLVAVLIEVSRFKFDVIWTTANFLDLLIVDPDTIAFLFQIFPSLRTGLIAGAFVLIPLLIAVWKLDPFRVRRGRSLAGAAGCLAVAGAMSLAVPELPFEPFQGINHVSGFFRSGALAVTEIGTHGWIQSDAQLSERLRALPGGACAPAKKPPHIVLVLDESSFDLTGAPGIKLPDGYADHFRSIDGKMRILEVEGTGGPTWYTEYNVLTGLSARSFGKLMFYVTRIAAGRVERGLAHTLRRCGYKTFSLYPTYGAFLSAKRFQHSAGVERVVEGPEMGAGDVDPDSFFYDQAAGMIAREHATAPLFLFVYTVANHFPWDDPYLPERTPGWRNPGNGTVIDEYIRRQMMSAQDYAAFTARLKREFPDDRFLIVRFGDHQPYISPKILEPGRPHAEVARNILAHDPRYFRTYYAIDAINFEPRDLSSAYPVLDAPYLPLVLLEAAGVPLDASFTEQKAILQRCAGAFYRCRDGAEARRFNRLLIDAGLIKGL